MSATIHIPQPGNLLIINDFRFWSRPLFCHKRKYISRQRNTYALVLKMLPMKIFGGFSKERNANYTWYALQNSKEYKRAEACCLDPEKGMHVKLPSIELFCRRIHEYKTNIQRFSLQAITKDGVIGWILFDRHTIDRITFL